MIKNVSRNIFKYHKVTRPNKHFKYLHMYLRLRYQFKLQYIKHNIKIYLTMIQLSVVFSAIV